MLMTALAKMGLAVIQMSSDSLPPWRKGKPCRKDERCKVYYHYDPVLEEELSCTTTDVTPGLDKKTVDKMLKAASVGY
jgi:hypothetical protein